MDSPYIHVMRKYRQEVYGLMKSIQESGLSEMYSGILKKFEKIVSLINPKIKSDECFEVAMELNQIFNYEQQYEKERTSSYEIGAQRS